MCAVKTQCDQSVDGQISCTHTHDHTHTCMNTHKHTHTPAAAITAPWRKHLETGASLVISPWSRLHPKWHRIPYIVHYFWPGPIGHYIGNRVPFGTHSQTLNSWCYRTRKGTCVVCPPFSVFYFFTEFLQYSTNTHKSTIKGRCFSTDDFNIHTHSQTNWSLMRSLWTLMTDALYEENHINFRNYNKVRIVWKNHPPANREYLYPHWRSVATGATGDRSSTVQTSLFLFSHHRRTWEEDYGPTDGN